MNSTNRQWDSSQDTISSVSMDGKCSNHWIHPPPLGVEKKVYMFCSRKVIIAWTLGSRGFILHFESSVVLMHARICMIIGEYAVKHVKCGKLNLVNDPVVTP